MFYKIVLLTLGIGILLAGAEFLVRGSRTIALRMGISTLIIGLTIVAFGTSAPELFVSLAASIEGTADVAVGNIIGSNIFNILVIIGITATLIPVTVAQSVVAKELPFMLIALGLMVLFSNDGLISRFEGVVLALGLVAYLILNYVEVTKAEKAVIEGIEDGLTPDVDEDEPRWKAMVFVLFGFVGLVIGAELIVDNAVWCARQFGVSELVIGITLVAVGTSLPELATTAMAARKGEPDLVVGNAVGSNIFNVLCVIGLTAMIQPLTVNITARQFDLPFMFFSCFAILPLLYFDRRIGRIAGVAMLITYGAYICVGVLG